jgi:hypothetical protein
MALSSLIISSYSFNIFLENANLRNAKREYNSKFGQPPLSPPSGEDTHEIVHEIKFLKKYQIYLINISWSIKLSVHNLLHNKS